MEKKEGKKDKKNKKKVYKVELCPKVDRDGNLPGVGLDHRCLVFPWIVENP